jgi:hypothetical protein
MTTEKSLSLLLDYVIDKIDNTKNEEAIIYLRFIKGELEQILKI